MEFWGVEVKAGSPLKVTPDIGKLIHISQAALGEGKSDKSGAVPLRVSINNKKFIVGSLSDKFPQITFDLVLEKEFGLSHDWKNRSVYFCGYMVDNPYEEENEDEFDSEEDEEELVEMAARKKRKAEEVTKRRDEAKRLRVPTETPELVVVEDEDEDDAPEVRREGTEPVGLGQQGSSDDPGVPDHVPPPWGEFFDRGPSDLELPRAASEMSSGDRSYRRTTSALASAINYNCPTVTPEVLMESLKVTGVFDPSPHAGLLALSLLNQFPQDKERMEQSFPETLALGQSMIPRGSCT